VVVYKDLAQVDCDVTEHKLGIRLSQDKPDGVMTSVPRHRGFNWIATLRPPLEVVLGKFHKNLVLVYHEELVLFLQSPCRCPSSDADCTPKHEVMDRHKRVVPTMAGDPSSNLKSNSALILSLVTLTSVNFRQW
jgi:hypothetical protein